jgi:phosphoribosylglycinamide formyltransferase-1
VGVLVSGRGSNLQAVLDASATPDFPAEVVVVVSSRAGALALDRAVAADVPAFVVRPGDFEGALGFEAEILDILRAHAVDVLCLAGFMRVLSGELLTAFGGPVLNVHPSLLPAFPGLHAVRQALAHGVKVAGCTVHLVTAGVDEGPILAQAAVEVRQDDTEASLAARILPHEHRLLPLALSWVAEGRCRVEGRRVCVENLQN